MSEANIAAVRSIYRAFADGDAEAAMASFDPAVVLHEPESLPYGGTYRGLEELGRAIGEITPYVDLASLKVDRLVGDEEVVVAFVRGSWRGEREVAFRECWTLRDRKVTEMHIFPWDTASLD